MTKKDRIIQLRDQGFDAYYIAKELNATPERVRFVMKHGVYSARDLGPPPPRECPLLVLLSGMRVAFDGPLRWTI